MQNEKCKSCFECSETVAVKVRDARGAEWRDSSVRRCANDQCWHIVDGTRQDRLLWIRNVYDYKYFGDYELSPEQLAAVYEALSLSAALSIEQTQPVKVKALEWRRAGWVEAFAKPEGFGLWYSIQPDKPVHGAGDPPFTCNTIWAAPGQNERECLGEDFPTLEAAKAAAQQDYETRILSALVNAQADADVVESLDARMKAAGMYTIAEMMAVTPMTKWMSNPAINTVEAFSEWLDRKVSEYLRMKAAYDLGDKDESDELYEWVQAHSAVFSTIRDQFQVVLSSLRPAEVGSATTTSGGAE